MQLDKCHLINGNNEEYIKMHGLSFSLQKYTWFSMWEIDVVV